MFFYKGGTKMSLEFYKSAFEKIINSGIIQNIYPMVDHIDVKYFRWNLIELNSKTKLLNNLKQASVDDTVTLPINITGT